MNKAYYDFATDALTVSSSFLKAASRFGSPEYREMMNYKKDHPTMKIVEKKRKESTFVSKKPHPSYPQMRAFIKLFSEKDAQNYLARMEKVMALSKFQRSPYNYVRDWFIDLFPNFSADALMDKDGNIETLMSKFDIEARALDAEMKAQIAALPQTAAETATEAA